MSWSDWVVLIILVMIIVFGAYNALRPEDPPSQLYEDRNKDWDH